MGTHCIIIFTYMIGIGALSPDFYDMDAADRARFGCNDSTDTAGMITLRTDTTYYYDTMSQCSEADWGLGRNPSNIVEMTGLSSRQIVNCYTSGRNDGTPGLHPGHTPYNNLDPWGGSHNGSNPRWFTDRGYPDWVEGGWPEQESHFNSRYSWANAEFTPRQTMRGKMALYAYLHALTKVSR